VPSEGRLQCSLRGAGSGGRRRRCKTHTLDPGGPSHTVPMHCAVHRRRRLVEGALFRTNGGAPECLTSGGQGPARGLKKMLTARKLVQSKLFDVENSLRGILRGFGLKVGKTTGRSFAGRTRDLVTGHPSLQMIAEA